MIKSLFTALLFLLVLSCGQVKRYNKIIARQHSVKQLHSDVDNAFNQLKKHHPKLYQYIPKDSLNFKIDSLKQTLVKPLNSKSFYKKIAPVLASVRQGHISISAANKRFTKKELKRIKKKKFEFYDLEFSYINNTLWVTGTRGKDSACVGSQVIKIEQDSINKLVKAYKKRFSSDGFNTTLHNNAVGKYFTQMYYKDKGFVNQLNITLKKGDSVYTKLFKRIPKKDLKKDKVNKGKSNKAISKTNKPLNKQKKKAFKKKKRRQGYLAKTKQFTRNFTFIGKDSTVAYMKIRSFTNGKFRAFYKSSFKQIENKNCKNLILDLRNNGGGRVAEIDYLYSFLSNKPYQFTKNAQVTSRLPVYKSIMSNTTHVGLKALSVIFAPAIITHNLIKTYKQDDVIYYKLKYSKVKRAKQSRFKGRIYVLINGNSFSASSLISTHLQATHRAVFVGEETGGAYNGCVAGIYKYYNLPNTKLKMRFGLMQIETPYTQFPDGYGIKPNRLIKPTIKDNLLKKDSGIDWVLNDIYK